MKTKINVKGMHCPSCDMLVEDSVGDLPGVNTVKSDHEKGIVEVNYDESQTNLEKIKVMIKNEGYEVAE